MGEVGMLFQAEMIRALRAGNKTETRRLSNPRAKAGDRMWVRETFAEEGTCIYYRADDKPGVEGWETPPGLKWTPSIHMPKRLARIWRDVIEVRQERLLSICDSGALAEGATPRGSGALARAYEFRIAGKVFEGPSPRAAFLAAWFGFNVNSDPNPIVTVYRFGHVEHAL